MRRFFTIAMVFIAFILSQMSAMAYPTHESGVRDAATVHIFRFVSGDLEDSRALQTCGTMSASFEFAGGTDAVSLYELDDASADADSGTLVTSFTADSPSPFVFNPARRYIKAVQTASDTGGSVLTIRCSNTDLSSAKDADILLGGQDGVSDVDNPNDKNGDGVFTDEVICTRTNADCFYLSTTSGWWGALNTDTTSDTDWGPLNLEVIWWNNLEANPAFGATLPSNTACIVPLEQHHLDGDSSCNAGEMYIGFPSDTTLLGFRYAITEDFPETEGCEVALTLDAGTSIESGTNFEIPDAMGGSTDAGTNDVHWFSSGLARAAGTSVQIMVGDGDNCDAGAACVGCGDVDDTGTLTLQLLGVRE